MFIKLITKELFSPKSNWIFSVFIFSLIITIYIFQQCYIFTFDTQTERFLRKKEDQLLEQTKIYNDDLRKATLKLTFNLVILPKDQDLAEWYNNDFSTKLMPEEYVDKLADSKSVLIRHLLPILQQRITWQQTQQPIILIGTRGEVPRFHKSSRSPLQQPVPDGSIVLGYELHTALAKKLNKEIKIGQKVAIKGDEFIIHKCHKRRGSKDDISAWIPLSDAQRILKKEGEINAILALECLCKGGNELLGLVRKDLEKYLPNTQVIERGSNALARAETRNNAKTAIYKQLNKVKTQRHSTKKSAEQLIFIIISASSISALIWLLFMLILNIRQRQQEIGILRSLGVSTIKIFTLLISKTIITLTLAIILGTLSGMMIGKIYLSSSNIITSIFSIIDWQQLLLFTLIGTIIACFTAWFPALIAATKDPMKILTNG